MYENEVIEKIGSISKCIVAIFSLFFSLNIDSAMARSISNSASCIVPTYPVGFKVEALQVRGHTPFMAEARWEPDGMPIIIYGPMYFAAPPFMQRWISAHECGHLTLFSSNEFIANCYALRQLQLDEGGLRRVASYHVSMGRMSPQYGGSGERFWRGTLQSCGYDI